MDPWMGRYIFPNAVIPSAKQMTTAIEGLFVIEDWHSFGPDYDRTLMAWYANCRGHWQGLPYDVTFQRMWEYLQVCAASFRARFNQLWQLVLSPSGVRGGYRSVR